MNYCLFFKLFTEECWCQWKGLASLPSNAAEKQQNKIFWKAQGITKSSCAIVTIRLFYLKFKSITSFICVIGRYLPLLFSLAFLWKLWNRVNLKEYTHHLDFTISTSVYLCYHTSIHCISEWITDISILPS